jgi:hypothetical protein
MTPESIRRRKPSRASSPFQKPIASRTGGMRESFESPRIVRRSTGSVDEWDSMTASARPESHAIPVAVATSAAATITTDRRRAIEDLRRVIDRGLAAERTVERQANAALPPAFGLRPLAHLP